QYGGTVWHLIGTRRMGPAADKSSVVSDELKVHGLENLRMIDASVMPSMPSANTYSATMVIAEKGSDLIRGKAAPAPGALPAHRLLTRRNSAPVHGKRGLNPLPVASMWPANGAPTWPGNTSAPVAAQCSSTVRRLVRACSASEFFGKFQSG